MNRLTVTKVHAIIVSQPTMLRNIGSSVVATAFAIQTEVHVGAMNKMGIVENCRPIKHAIQMRNDS